MTDSAPFNPQPGDCVQLKSGGYQMTVCKVTSICCDNPPTAVECIWHSEQGEVNVYTFPIFVLMPAVDEDESK